MEDDYETIEFTVPVSAVVNLATGEVERVIVHDDQGGDYRFWPGPDPAPDARERFDRAVRLADNGQPWPAWEFGY